MALAQPLSDNDLYQALQNMMAANNKMRITPPKIVAYGSAGYSPGYTTTAGIIPNTHATKSMALPLCDIWEKAFDTTVEDIGNGWFLIDYGEWLVDLIQEGDEVVMPGQQATSGGSKLPYHQVQFSTENEYIEALIECAEKNQYVGPVNDLRSYVTEHRNNLPTTLSQTKGVIDHIRKEYNRIFTGDLTNYFFNFTNSGWGMESWNLQELFEKIPHSINDPDTGFSYISRFRFPVRPTNPAEYIARSLRNTKRLTRKPLPPPVPITIEILDKAILPEDTKQEIVSVLKQFQNASQLFEDWGLGEVIEYGRGMIFLFWGGPGTGKTFTANLMARALGKPLMTLGAAELESSTPGEYERNVAAAFEEAKKKKSVLFFDECDGMIQSRTGMGQIMSGQNNKFLQEIEKFEGVVVMATNRVDSLDEALERRISLIVEFKHPDQPQREQIFTRMIPAKMPLDKDVKLPELAAHYLSGGEIKNVILNAARFAASRADSPEDFKKLKVKKADFLKAIERVMSGRKAFDRPRSTGHVQQHGPTRTMVKG